MLGARVAGATKNAIQGSKRRLFLFTIFLSGQKLQKVFPEKGKARKCNFLRKEY